MKLSIKSLGDLFISNLVDVLNSGLLMGKTAGRNLFRLQIIFFRGFLTDN